MVIVLKGREVSPSGVYGRSGADKIDLAVQRKGVSLGVHDATSQVTNIQFKDVNRKQGYVSGYISWRNPFLPDEVATTTVVEIFTAEDKRGVRGLKKLIEYPYLSLIETHEIPLDYADQLSLNATEIALYGGTYTNTVP